MAETAGAFASAAPSAARVGIGGPVGSGKTALIEGLLPLFADARHLAWPSSPTTW